MSFSRDYLGSVEVKNGAILLAGVGARTDERWFLQTAEAIRGSESQSAPIEGVGVMVATAFADGAYAVHGTYNEKNELVSVEITLDQPEEA
jgi:hypothetical protein